MSNSNKPRPALTRQNATTNLHQGTGRAQANANAPVMQNMASAARKQLETHIGQGPGKMHAASTTRLHEERAYIYDQMSKGKRMQTVNNFKTGLNPLNNISKNDRRNLTAEANSLKTYKDRMKTNNKDAVKREKIGTNLGHVKKGARVANYVGTGVAFANPAAGLAIKASAKGVGIASGIGATVAYDRASKAYAKNVDDKATGMNMLDSHISAQKSELTATKRNKTAVSTAASVAFGAGGFGVDAALEGANTLTESLVSSGFDAAKTGSKKAIGMAFSSQIRDNKSEIVNLMRHQKAFEPKPGLIQTRARSNAVTKK